MSKLVNTQSGLIHTLPLLVIVAAVGIISYLLISSTAPFKGGLFGILNSKPTSNAASSITLNVNNADVHQTMLGFGATNQNLYYGASTGSSITPDQRNRAIDAIYNQVKINTGQIDRGVLEAQTTDYGTRGNDNSDPNTINWSGFQGEGADASKTLLIDLASPLGFNDYLLPATLNTRYSQDWLQPIKASNYQLYLQEEAEYVLASVQYWKDKYGITTPLTFLMNEPIWGNGQVVGANFQELTDLVKASGAKLRAAGFSTKFLITNEEQTDHTYEEVSAILADPVARQYVGAIGYHTYPYQSNYANINNILTQSGMGNPNAGEISIRNQLRDLGKQYGLPVMLTEVCCGGVDPKSFDDVRGRAIHIHDEFEYADAAAYFGMNNMWDSNSQLWHQGNTDLSGQEGTIVLVDVPNNNVYLTGMGYAIGHYARWIKKGAVRIGTTSSDPLVQISAFRDDSQNKLVYVVINNNNNSTSVTINTQAITMSGSIKGEQSTANGNWVPLTAFNPSSSTSFTTTVPALSVTTFSVNDVSGGPTPTPTPRPTPTPPGNDLSFVSGITTLGGLRNDYGNFVGTQIHIGGSNLTVTQLGRYFVNGNNQTHTVELVRVSDKAVVASSNLNMAQGVTDNLGFKYGVLSPFVTLTANTDYYLVTQEMSGGDQWEDSPPSPTVTHTNVASIPNSIWFDGNWNTQVPVDSTYGPVNFKYLPPVSTPSPTPTSTSTPTPRPTSTPTIVPTPTPIPTPTPNSCPKGSLGDIDCNGKIDIFDYNTLVGNFGKSGVGPSGGDIDLNGKVDIFDYNILVTNFGK